MGSENKCVYGLRKSLRKHLKKDVLEQLKTINLFKTCS